MATVSSGKHYGVKLTVHISNLTGCCGAGILHGFGIDCSDRAARELTLRQKNKLYKALMYNVLEAVPNYGILVGSDAVDGWSGGNSGGTRPVKDMCMADFMRYFKATESAVGDNGNSGNGIATFTLVKCPRDGDDLEVKMPRFPAPKQPKRPRTQMSGDRAAIIAQLREVIHGS